MIILNKKNFICNYFFLGFITDVKFPFQVAASMQKEVDAHIPNYPNLPTKLICLLHNVTLHVCFWFSLFLLIRYKCYETAFFNYPLHVCILFGCSLGWCRDRWSLCSDDTPACQFSKYWLCCTYKFLLFATRTLFHHLVTSLDSWTWISSF